jgi:hypothetical protein
MTQVKKTGSIQQETLASIEQMESSDMLYPENEVQSAAENGKMTARHLTRFALAVVPALYSGSNRNLVRTPVASQPSSPGSRT